MSFLSCRFYFQRGKPDAGNDQIRKARARKALDIGLHLRLWQAHVFDGKNQALYVREAIESVENFRTRIFAFINRYGVVYDECVASAQDIGLHHRSLKTLYYLYRWKFGRSAKIARETSLSTSATLLPDDSGGDPDAPPLSMKQLVHTASALREDWHNAAEVHGDAALNSDRKVVLPEVMSMRGVPYIDGFLLADAMKLVNVHVLERAKNLTLRNIRIVDAATGAFARFCVTASVESSSDPSMLYQQRFLVFATAGKKSWNICEVQRPTRISLCTCANSGQCKHQARALLATCQDSDLLGEANAGVPEHVHSTALWAVNGQLIPRTTPAQRQENSVPSMKTLDRAPAEMAQFWTYGYISPAYPDPPARHRWVVHNGDHMLWPLDAAEL